MTKMKIQQFLAKHCLLADDIESDGLISEFLIEMAEGLANKASSLAMIPTYISANKGIPANDPVIVIDAGGTNLRVASISFDRDNRARIKDYAKYPMPGSKTEVSAAEFFDQLSQHLQPVLNRSNKIGFCFSYPAEISPDMDGRLLRWTKEMKAPEVVGRFVGRGLIEALGPAGTGKSVVLLNDTVATLLAGKVAGKEPYGTYVGFILGTGINIAYLEKNKYIRKMNRVEPSGSQAVNVESGGFSKAPRGDIDIQLDQKSEDPGINRFEKMISGRYLPKIALGALKTGVEEGLFDASGCSWIRGLRQLGHARMEDLINSGGAGISKSVSLTEVDRGRIQAVMKAVIKRAAKLAAINITATVVKAVGESFEQPVCINIDGSAYYKTEGLRENTEKYLKKMLRARNIRYALVHSQRAPMIGAAIAGLVN
jgi:hexokinase